MPVLGVMPKENVGELKMVWVPSNDRNRSTV